MIIIELPAEMGIVETILYLLLMGVIGIGCVLILGIATAVMLGCHDLLTSNRKLYIYNIILAVHLACIVVTIVTGLSLILLYFINHEDKQLLIENLRKTGAVLALLVPTLAINIINS